MNLISSDRKLHLKQIMQITKIVVLLFTFSLSLVIRTEAAQGKNQAVEVLKYLSPLPEKTYLNESQDRLIKKKNFKVSSNINALAQNKELGIFATVPANEIDQIEKLEEVLKSQDVNGLSVTLTWKTLEPLEGEYNWQPLDNLLDLVARHGKTLMVRIATCGIDLGYGASNAEEANTQNQSDTPKWVFDNGAKSASYTGKDGKSHVMPIFWDTTYLASWSNLIKEMGRRYDKNPAIHSIGITGGGTAIGTAVIPNTDSLQPTQRDAYRRLELCLRKEHGMSQRQLVEHWKYVADLFPKAFPNARLNFNIDPPTPNRAGQDTLDEIADYLVYRYGQRIYLTRQDITNDKHGFDQYRLLLKFHNDTYTGYQLAATYNSATLEKLVKNALDDGISFVEVPTSLLESTDVDKQKLIHKLASHIGYQIVAQKVVFPHEVKSGEPIEATFALSNLGAASPLRPSRNFDKDIAQSFRIQIELRNQLGEPVVISYHTPEVPTNHWTADKPITWQESLKMPPLPSGKYTVFMSLIDSETKRKITVLNSLAGDNAVPQEVLELGTLQVDPSTNAIGTTNSSETN